MLSRNKLNELSWITYYYINNISFHVVYSLLMPSFWNRVQSLLVLSNKNDHEQFLDTFVQAWLNTWVPILPPMWSRSFILLLKKIRSCCCYFCCCCCCWCWCWCCCWYWCCFDFFSPVHQQLKSVFNFKNENACNQKKIIIFINCPYSPIALIALFILEYLIFLNVK